MFKFSRQLQGSALIVDIRFTLAVTTCIKHVYQVTNFLLLFSRFDFQSYLHCSCVYQQHQQNRMVHHQQPPKVWSQSPKSNPGIGKKGLKINWHFDSEVNAGIQMSLTSTSVIPRLGQPVCWVQLVQLRSLLASAARLELRLVTIWQRLFNYVS